MKRSSPRFGPALAGMILAQLAVLSGDSSAQDMRPTAISGKVVSAQTGERMFGVEITVIGTGQKATTDIEGTFRIPVLAGTYELRVSLDGFQTQRITDVRAIPNEAADVRVAMVPADAAAQMPASGAPGGVETIEVVATASKAAESAALVERQVADVVEDTISAETFQRAPDSNVGEIVERLASVTVEDDFIFVRGLGERYSTAVLNGSRLPSTNPDKRVIPLDLFPADFVESLAIIKSYSPNLEGDFAGGLVDIRLKTFPSELTWKVGMDIGGNTNTTFQDFKTYATARELPDFFGVDTSRGLPSVFGDERVVFTSQQDAAAYAATLKDIWSAESITAPIDGGLDFEVGNTFGDFGFNFAALWENDYETIPDQIERQFTTLEGDEPVLGEDFVYDSSTFETTLGALFTSAYDINDDNRINLRVLYQRVTGDEVLIGKGFRRNNPEVTLDTTRLTYQAEQLVWGQLQGDHAYEDLELSWRSAFGWTSLDRPDTRTTVYASSPGNPTPVYSRVAGSGSRLFLDVKEKLSDTQGEMAVPFGVWDEMEARFRIGGAYTWRDRNSQLRKFLFRPTNTSNVELYEMMPEAFLNAEMVESGATNFFEETAPQDSFSANESIIAGYAMLELPLIEDQLRFVGGLRGENSVIDITYFRQDQQGAPVDRSLINLDPMPAASLVYSPREDMNVRGGYSQTVSRPEFRELSPIQFPEPFGLRTVVGNPDLVETTIQSVDLRWEWFLSNLELASMSFFYKDLDQPIETTVVSLSGSTATSFANSESATLYGLEWELRKDFSFISDDFADFMIFLNASWIESNSISVDDPGEETRTNTEGPLQGQAPFIINTTIQYSHDDWGVFRLLYRTEGSTLDAFGFNGLPDIFFEPRNQLDFVYTFDVELFEWPIDMKFSVENILNDQYVWMQSGIVQQSWKSGVTFGLSASYRY
ncbi:MAG: hypothetical protein FJ144_12855 [Deltaproteobacteria bacterium]|nr:hypothetical protein [Deltaproteobacteria bacterium]